MSEFNYTKKPVNGNVPSDDWLNAIRNWFKTAPSFLFASNPAPNDVYGYYSKKFGPWRSDEYRRGFMAMVLRCLASQESSFIWSQGKDPDNDNPDPRSYEAGCWQVSLDSIGNTQGGQGFSLKQFLVDSIGSASDAALFQRKMKPGKDEDKSIPIHYIVLLLRNNVGANGPIIHGIIEKYFTTQEVEEWIKLIGIPEKLYSGQSATPPAATPTPVVSSSTFVADSRSEGNIATLLPPVQILARKWLEACKKVGLSVKIIDGSRTYAQQDAIYAKGRTTPGAIVTNAKGGQSLHNFGIAWDFGVFSADGSKYIEESPIYRTAGKIATTIAGLEWGGDWTGNLVDEPHIQYKTGLTLAQMRALHDKGQPVVK